MIAGFERINEELEEMNTRMLLSGKYDDKDCILSIHSGTGGVDANDWAEMLERMYLRYCEKRASRPGSLTDRTTSITASRVLP